MAEAAGAHQRVQMRVRNPDLPDDESCVSSTDGDRRTQSMQRLILKQGYLKEVPNAAKLEPNLEKAVRRWFVFGVTNGADPYLEYYEDEDSVLSSHPINVILLDVCYSVKLDACHDNVFIVALRDKNLRLVAQSRSIMLEWATVIREKLEDLYILQPHSDMPDEMKTEAMELCVTACEKFSTNNETAAKMIKDTMDKKFGASWHVVVGEGFGFEMTHEIKNMMYMFFAGTTAILLWKCS